MLPSKGCLLDIMTKGHAEVLEFLCSIDPTFLPEPYQESRPCEQTIWHHEIAALVYDINPSLIPLERLYRHAFALGYRELVYWTRTKIRETDNKSFKPSVDDLSHAVGSCDWPFVHWVVQNAPNLHSGIVQRIILWGKHYCFFYDSSKRTEIVMFLKCLFEQTADSALLPTVDDLRDQPIEYVTWVCQVNPSHLSRQALVSLCTSHTVGLELVKWIADNMQIDLADCEMASAAARAGNVSVLNWVATKNPSVFISKECIKEGMGNVDRDETILIWALFNAPTCLPEWEFLDERGYQSVFPEIFMQVKLYQEGQKATTQGEKF
jgi:hypothetical protein